MTDSESISPHFSASNTLNGLFFLQIPAEISPLVNSELFSGKSSTTVTPSPPHNMVFPLQQQTGPNHKSPSFPISKVRERATKVEVTIYVYAAP